MFENIPLISTFLLQEILQPLIKYLKVLMVGFEWERKSI